MKILIIQLRRIGDILLTTPVFPFLKQHLPGATIDFLSEPDGHAVLETNPHLRCLFIYDKSRRFHEIKRVRSEKYDAVLDFMCNPRTRYLTACSGAHYRIGFYKGLDRIFYSPALKTPIQAEYVVQRKLRLAAFFLKHVMNKDVDLPPALPELWLTPEDERFADAFLQAKNIAPGSFVAMSPLHRYAVRQWRVEGFRDVAKQIYERFGLRTLLSHGPGEEEQAQQVRLGAEHCVDRLPKTTLRQAAAFYKRAKLLITQDSGALHNAMAVGTPTVAVFGPTRPRDFHPEPTYGFSQRSPHLYVTADPQEVPCLGCHLRECPIGHVCMKEVTASMILRQVERILQ